MIDYLFGSSAWLVWAVITLLDLVAITALLYRSQGVERTLAWLFAVIAFPGFGAVTYLLIADPTIKRTTIRHRQRTALHPDLAKLMPGDSAESHVLTCSARATGYEPSTGNNIEVLAGDDTAFACVEATLHDARDHIWAEYYLIRRDETGHRFLDILAEKARQGVKVRLLYDALGSFRMSKPRLKAIIDAGGHCQEFLPINPLRKRWAIHLRNHRKIVVVDGRKAFTGGMNVGDEYSGRARRRGTVHFSDTHLYVEGPCVEDLAEVFAEDWNFATGERLNVPAFAGQAAGTSRVAIIPSGPDQVRNASQLAYFTGISTARRMVWLNTPYFIPDEAILCALISAALKGVDVRVMVPSRCDVLLVGSAGRSYYRQLLEAGVRIFEFTPAMLHAKTMIVDERLALVGSANFDIRSFRLNFEVGTLVDDQQVAEFLQQRFLVQQNDSIEITLEEAKDWPFPTRMRHGVARLFSPLL